MSRYIKKLILQGEHGRQDFKYAINDSRKIAKSLSAFANTLGGTLLIGIKDNGAIVGVKSDEEYYMIDAAAQSYCRPEVAFSSKAWKVDGKDILEIAIPQSIKKPVLAEREDRKWLAYLRVNDENILANGVWIEYWRLLRNPHGVLIKYSEKEQLLLEYLKKHPSLTISEFQKIAKISRYKATRTIARLASIHTLKIQFNENQFEYILKE